MGRKIIMPYSKEECLFCGFGASLEDHHVFHGTANRKLSDKYGLIVRLCKRCHTGPKGVHFNPSRDNWLKVCGQIIFQREYPDLDFVEIFGKNYIDANGNE